MLKLNHLNRERAFELRPATVMFALLEADPTLGRYSFAPPSRLLRAKPTHNILRVGRGVVPGIWVIDFSRRSYPRRIGNGAGRTRIDLPFHPVRDLASLRSWDEWMVGATNDASDWHSPSIAERRRRWDAYMTQFSEIEQHIKAITSSMPIQEVEDAWHARFKERSKDARRREGEGGTKWGEHRPRVVNHTAAGQLEDSSLWPRHGPVVAR